MMSKESIIDSNDIILRKNIIKDNFSLKNVKNSIKNRQNDKYIIVDCENPIVIEQKIDYHQYYSYFDMSFINEFNNLVIHPDVCKCISLLLLCIVVVTFTLLYKSTYNNN